MIFNRLLALSGLATLGAAYSLPGAYERLLLYNTYRMNLMIGGNEYIANGCTGTGGNPCTLEEFIKYINHGDLVVEEEVPVDNGKGKGKGKGNTAGKGKGKGGGGGGKGGNLDLGLGLKDGEVPNVKKTAEILMRKKINGQIDPQKVIKGTKGDYPQMFKKIGEFIDNKWGKKAVKPADADTLLKLKRGAFESMVAVRNARMEAAVTSWKPSGVQVVQSVDDLGGIWVDMAETAQKSKKGVADVEALFNEHIKGPHAENINYLRTSVTAVCGKGGGSLKRGLGGCGQAIVGENWSSEFKFPGIGGAEGEAVAGAKLGSSAAEVAEAVSEREFVEQATRRGLKDLAQKKWAKSLSDVRTSLKYEPVTAETPKTKLSGIKAGGLVVGGALQVAGVGFWLYSVVDSFRRNVTGLERAATVASIAPFVGCAVKTAADVEKQSLDVVDTSLCVLADGMLFTPAFPVAIILHLTRSLMSWYRPPEKPTLQQFRAQRDAVWTRYLESEVYAYIYSHPYYHRFMYKPEPTDPSFLEKFRAAIAIDELAVLSQGARTIGVTTGSAQDELEAAESDEDKATIQHNIDAAAEQLRLAARRKTIRRQRELLLTMPKSLQETQEASLIPLSTKFNDDFAFSLVSDEMVYKYQTNYNGQASEILGESSDKKDVKALLDGYVDQLLRDALELPSYFDLAYVLGQSRALGVSDEYEALDPLVLSVSAHLEDTLPSLGPSQRQMVALNHTFEMGLVISGRKKEWEAQTYFPTTGHDDEAANKDLRTLVALKFGRTYDDWKVAEIAREMPWAPDGEPAFDGLRRQLVNPQVPPLVSAAGSYHVALVAGLSVALADSLRENAAALGKSGTGVSMLEQSDQLKVVPPSKKTEAAAARLRRALPRSSKEYRAQMGAVKAY